MERAIVAGAVGLLLAVGVASALAHGGGLNAEGCHNERKTGGYHCHRAPAVPPASARSSTQQLAEPAARPATPTCYVGPKGGTYTLTASGKKNYKGC